MLVQLEWNSRQAAYLCRSATYVPPSPPSLPVKFRWRHSRAAEKDDKIKPLENCRCPSSIFTENYCTGCFEEKDLPTKNFNILQLCGQKSIPFENPVSASWGLDFACELQLDQLGNTRERHTPGCLFGEFQFLKYLLEIFASTYRHTGLFVWGTLGRSWNIGFQYFSSFWSLSFMFVHSHLFIALFLKKNILILFTLRSPLIHSDMTNENEDLYGRNLQVPPHCGN